MLPYSHRRISLGIHKDTAFVKATLGIAYTYLPTTLPTYLHSTHSMYQPYKNYLLSIVICRIL